MDQQQLDIALEVVKLDCTIVDRLRDGEGGFCAVGGLYAVLDPDWAEGTKSESSLRIYREVREAFGLHTTMIVEANDTSGSISDRRKRVRKELERQFEVGSC